MRRRFRLLSVPVLLLLAGTFAITQEIPPGPPGESGIETEPPAEALEFDSLYGQEPAIPEEPPPEWVHAGRWFSSNAGGMALEEIHSPFAALRNEYALLIDFVGKEELPEKLLPFYQDQYYIEIRILYERGDESRRQWIFRDADGLNRLVAVLNVMPADEGDEGADSETAEEAGGESFADNGPAPDIAADNAAPEDTVAPEESPTEIADNAAAETGEASGLRLAGFIEIYNENYLLEKEYIFYESGDERETDFFYRNETLVRAETGGKTFEDGNETATKLFTDNYRYNRSHSLRLVERIYHDRVEENTVRLGFPNRVLDAAADDNFISEKLYLGSDFFGSYTVDEGQQMVFTTDERGRILTQTLKDGEDNEIWVIENTWSGERIVSAERTEGEDKRLHEYDYSDNGDLTEERNYHNGILERQVRIADGREVEELFINGVAALRAVWEDGRKISEERIQERKREQ